MSEGEEFHSIDSFIEVPDRLKSSETGELLSHCIDCGSSLLGSGTSYLIQKAFQGSEPVVEYAQCFSCYENLTASYSKQSMSSLWNFFLDSYDMEKRKAKLLAESSDRLDPWIEECITCGTSKSEAESFAIVGQCDGPHLLFYYLPYLICGNCQMRMQDLLSSKSRDIWDRWYEDNIGTPPVMEKDYTPGKVVLV